MIGFVIEFPDVSQRIFRESQGVDSLQRNIDENNLPLWTKGGQLNKRDSTTGTMSIACYR